MTYQVMRRSIVRTIAAVCSFVGILSANSAETVSVAAASDLVFCLEELNAAFQANHPGIEIKTTTGASGNIFAQIQNGAPFDVFLSADIKYPRELIKAGLAPESSLQPYAIGHLVVWTRRDGIDISPGVSSLRSASIRKVALANPEHAPYGRAAKAALETTGIWAELQDKLVFGENIAQTAQFVETGNADAGLVALSLVLSPRLAGKGKWVEVPESAFPRLEQAAVLTHRGAANPAAVAYMAFLRSARARAVFEKFGFRLPE